MEPMRARPLVSVLVPAFNAAKFLRESLDSLLGQTYKNIEIILLDDASNDATSEIVTEYADRIVYVRQKLHLSSCSDP